mmetsp:Transcript_134641/g.418430  ORF Transcript_134641/g.418430 Transcript_134641/m.418430 type:complete len:258 (+) Transcript_134641:90-863(+)
MAVMLRFLGQASKQTTQHLAPPALTPKRLAVGGATPRTPKTPANDASPFFGGQSPTFFQSLDELPPPPPQPLAAAATASLKKPTTLGFALPRHVDFGEEELPDSPASVVAEDAPDTLRLKSPAAPEGARDRFFLKSAPPAAGAGGGCADAGPSAEGGAAGSAVGERAPLKVGTLPVLLGRRFPDTAKLDSEPKIKIHAPEAASAHEAFLARQRRIAARPSLPEGTGLRAQVELAQATREAFLSRQRAISGRRLLTRA